MNATWTDFYTKFAYKLLEYKNNRIELITKINEAFNKTNLTIPTIEENNNIIDIDPFTIYAFFNRQIREDKRIGLIKALNEEFEVRATLPSEFNGIPILDNRNTSFFAFKSRRNESDIDNLWDMLEIALLYSKNSSYKDKFMSTFDTCQKQLSVRWNLTMGLFWFEPNYYISLDSRSRWYMSRTHLFDQGFVNFLKEHHASVKENHIPSGKEYLEIRDKCYEYINNSNNYNSFIELSQKAWVVSVDVNNLNKEKLTEKPLDERGIHTWIYSPSKNPEYLDDFIKDAIIAVDVKEIDNPSQYQTREEIRLALQYYYQDSSSHKNDALCLWQFIHDMKIGDVVFVKKGRYEIVARGIITSNYIYDDNKKEYKNIRNVKWTNKGSWQHPGLAVTKTLTDITNYREYVEKLNNLFENEAKDLEYAPINNSNDYNKQDFLTEVYINEEEYNKMVKLLENKQNLILQGAPGVGKSFIAKRLAYSIMEVKDQNRVETIQFHQSYSYEDFIMGYRPNGVGFILEGGVFYNFCKKAAEDSEKNIKTCHKLHLIK